jgi:hypothetical protein
VHLCPATDLCDDDGFGPLDDGIDTVDDGIDLLGAGFDTVDLSSMDELQSVLSRVRAAGAVTDADAAAIRGQLDGAVLHTPTGLRLTVLHLAGEGLFMRKSGPNRRSVVAPESVGMNDHGAATSVHADQDVFGTPVRQLMDGRAPTLFRHDSPDGSHHDASLMLVNLWIPLQQVTQPLVLADGRSIDRRRHQLRLGLPTESFLDRDDDMAVNDIWTFLHDPGQRWYFRSRMDQRSAYVFDTLSTAHGAGVLSGEELAERCWLALQAAEAASSAGDAAGLVGALSDPELRREPERATPPLRVAIAAMAALVDEALADPAAVCGSGSAEWVARAAAARGAVVRMSLELRVVVSVEEAALGSR